MHILFLSTGFLDDGCVLNEYKWIFFLHFMNFVNADYINEFLLEWESNVRIIKRSQI